LLYYKVYLFCKQFHLWNQSEWIVQQFEEWSRSETELISLLQKSWAGLPIAFPSLVEPAAQRIRA